MNVESWSCEDCGTQEPGVHFNDCKLRPTIARSEPPNWDAIVKENESLKQELADLKLSIAKKKEHSRRWQEGVQSQLAWEELSGDS